MPGLAVSYTRHACGLHGHAVLSLDGVETQLNLDERDFAGYQFDAERFLTDCFYQLHVVKGVPLESIAGRVVFGEEATNVKQYGILTKDVTKTNIGTSYVNVPPGANGERTLVEFTGCTEFRIMVHGVLNGTGPYQMRIVRDSDNAVLYESASINAQAGEREFDSGILPLPAEATGLIYVRFQAKSTTATDDPVLRRCVLMVR